MVTFWWSYGEIFIPGNAIYIVAKHETDYKPIPVGRHELEVVVYIYFITYFLLSLR